VSEREELNDDASTPIPHRRAVSPLHSGLADSKRAWPKPDSFSHCRLSLCLSDAPCHPVTPHVPRRRHFVAHELVEPQAHSCAMRVAP
jgi:hypothetical protein